MRELETCTRCGKVIDPEFDDVDDFESIELESGKVGLVCAGCLTGEEQQATDDDDMDALDALDDERSGG